MDEAETTAEELQELIRQGHAMIKDLSGVIKGLNQTKADLAAQLQEVHDAPKADLVAEFRRHTDEAMKQVSEEVAEAVTQTVGYVEEEIHKRFDLIMSTILGIDQARAEQTQSIPEMLSIAAAAAKVKVDLGAIDKLATPIERRQA